MIRERFIHFIILSTLFGLMSNGSKASATNLLKYKLLGESSTGLSNNDCTVKEIENYDLSRYRVRQTIYLTTALSPTATRDDSMVDDPSREIDRRLSLIAMAITLAISLFLLWVLFKKQPQERQTIVELSTTDEPKKLQEVAENRVRSQSSTEANITVVSEVSSQEDNRGLPTFFGDLTNISKYEGNDILAKNKLMPWAMTPFVKEGQSTNMSFQINYQAANIDVVDELIKDLQQSDRQLRRKAIWDLATKGDARSIEPLVELMSQVNSLDRGLISQAITQILHRSFQPINDELFNALQDENPDLRKSAIRDLTALYLFVAPITKQLVQMQLDADPEVSQTAIQALQQLNLSSFSKPFNDRAGEGINTLAPRKEGEANLHLVAYLLAELDTER